MSSPIVKRRLEMLPGFCHPLGATCIEGGVNFSVFSKHATGMELVLFPSESIPEIITITLDPDRNKTYNYWHVFVQGLAEGQEYGFRVSGPFNPSHGMRFDSEKLLLDPYARAIVGWDRYERHAAIAPGDNIATALRSQVIGPNNYDWENDAPPRTAYAESIIYEMHVGGFTRDPSSGVAPEKRGTFAGIIEKIPYLKQLGVTAVELMPVQEFEPGGARPGMSNYWGYDTVGFFAPHHGYCQHKDARGGIDEFRDMVKALHKAGIEVILDVVFNHTAEGNENGPTHSFRGLDNSIYYLLDPFDKAKYSNFSGCGNSFNANHPIVGRLIIDSLRYWVSEMHVDGFRFDLAAALARDVFGQPLQLPPLLWTIESDPVLAGTKLIAEAWDAAGLYRVGWFINTSEWYAEWNGPFRDDVRRFVKADSGSVSRLAARLTGSPDLYIKPDREPNRSINFITCHDGFTLRDLVCYNDKHNDANGENNCDGNNDNHSWNCGVEGPSDDIKVEALRIQQMKNMLTILFLSQGTPMILMGDEVGRTQQGNNNAYCHDNKLTWFNWTLVEKNYEIFRFLSELIAFTQSLDIFRQRKTIGIDKAQDRPYIVWHGLKLFEPDWGNESHSLAFTLENPVRGERLHVMLNSFWEPLDCALPPVDAGGIWLRIMDTSLVSPQDISSPEFASAVSTTSYCVMPRSIAVFFAGKVNPS